jgi:hypothetical protein
MHRSFITDVIQFAAGYAYEPQSRRVALIILP